MKNILIIATGGTIASTDEGQGLAPHLNVDDLLSFIPSIKDKFNIASESIMNVDSTNMSPEDWQKIAIKVKEEYSNYDGFVITHGTDTMAYTSSALSFMISNLNKPVILTGSQYSITENCTDAQQNLSDAIIFAGQDIKGVFIVFDGKLIVGTRAMKIKTKSYDAFESVNFPYVAEIKHSRITYNKYIETKFLKNENENELSINTKISNKIQVIKLFPGMNVDIFDYLAKNYKGIIIESFGIGGIPFGVYNISEKIKELALQNVAVAVTTQCLEEGVEFGLYEVGKKIPKDNVIYANDMNTEALVAKMICALGNFTNISDIKNYIEKPIFFDIYSSEH
ncbi:asparaginase [Helicovermis profundi]|uniref:asparaginase n=1 Tax=Helicovermis profundi TaxID=3065157 RepID=A0AAU9E692_9FIRM|nr:asparaginase [Clostridia bacterium S502]